MNEKSIPTLPVYPHALPMATLAQQKPLLKLMGRMMAKRMRLPRGKAKVVSQSVKIKQKKVKYW